MKFLIVLLAVLLLVGIAQAATILFVPQGGTGQSSFSPNSILVTGTSTTNGFQATSTITLNTVIATSTTATSTFVNASSTFQIISQQLLVGTTTAKAPISLRGHIQTGATSTPTVSSCGTGPTISGSDMAGRIVVGTGIVSSCLVTFTTSWTNAPVCLAEDETAILLTRAVSTVSSVTLSVATDFAGDTVDYFCIGYE